MSAAVGADIESICSKCGDVWHVVVAKVGDRIAKVQCKECHAFHRYKAPAGKVPSGGAPRPKTRAAGAGTKPAQVTTERMRKAPPELPPEIGPDLSRPVRRYAASEAFATGDRVQHPTFGMGVVQSAGPGKMDVAFPGGRRTLAQAKGGLGLARPTTSFDEG